VLSFGYWTTDFLIVQRAFTAKNLQTARLTPIVASFFKMALPFIVVVAGLVAFKLSALGQLNLERDAAGNIVNADSALPLLIARYYPAGLVGLGITALLAGFMAGQAGNTSAFNTVFTYDIYKAAIKRDASDEHLVLVGRIFTIVGILLSVVTAYVAKSFPTIMDYIQAIFSWVNAPLFATMLLGMFWKRTTSSGAFWGLIAGMLTSFMLFLAFKFKWFGCEWYYYLTFMASSKGLCPAVPSDMTLNLWQAAWAWIVCFGLTIIISLFTKPKSDEELQGLVKGLTPDPDLEKVPLYKRPLLWAVVSLGVLIFLNIYFW